MLGWGWRPRGRGQGSSRERTTDVSQEACNVCEGSGVVSFPDGSESICFCPSGDEALASMVAPAHPNYQPWSQEAVAQYTAGRLKSAEEYRHILETEYA